MNQTVHLEFDRRPSALRYMLLGMLPLRRRMHLVPAITTRWRDHRVDPGELRTFLRITGLRSGATLPLLYPHSFGFRLVMAMLTHPSFPVPIWGVLQTRNHIVQHRPIALDAPMDFETRVIDGRCVPKGAEFDIATTVHVAGELAWQSTVTFFTRGRFGEPASASPLARTPSVAGSTIGEWTLGDGDHARFGSFTGDYNGIHLSDWYARRFGFRRAFYHPPRVLGECLARLPALNDGEPQQFDAWLKGPVHHGVRVRLQAQDPGDATRFALFADDERPCIVGQFATVHPTASRRGPP